MRNSRTQMAAFCAARPSFPPIVTAALHICFSPGSKLPRLTLIQVAPRRLLWELRRPASARKMGANQWQDFFCRLRPKSTEASNRTQVPPSGLPSSQWFWYDGDSCSDDPHELYNFFVVSGDRIVRENVSFGDYHDRGFDPAIFESFDNSDSIWLNDSDWREATTRFWITSSKIGIFCC